MGFMINKKTFEMQNCPSALVMVSNGWNPDDWEFVEELESFSDIDGYNAKKIAVEVKYQAGKKITKRQLWFWLFQSKAIEREAIDSAIDGITDPAKKYLAKASYDGTNDFEYGNPFVAIIGKALGLTTEDLIKCFDEAINL